MTEGVRPPRPVVAEMGAARGLLAILRKGVWLAESLHDRRCIQCRGSVIGLLKKPPQ
jgi:hypothetical protein